MIKLLLILSVLSLSSFTVFADEVTCSSISDRVSSHLVLESCICDEDTRVCNYKVRVRNENIGGICHPENLYNLRNNAPIWTYNHYKRRCRRAARRGQRVVRREARNSAIALEHEEEYCSQNGTIREIGPNGSSVSNRYLICEIIN